MMTLEHFREIAAWYPPRWAYLRQNGLDHQTVIAHAGFIAVMPIRFTDNGFHFDEDGGAPAVVIEALAEDGETVLDLVAWPTIRPDRFTTAFGEADALGIGNILLNPGSWAFGRVLQMHRTPLGWLQGGCTGTCVLDHRFISYWLRQAPGPIRAEDSEHARQLDLMLNPKPFPRSRIRVPPAPNLRRAA